MPAKLNFKIFLLFVCFCAFASATVAQEKKAQAWKFDEFDDAGEWSFYSDRDELTFADRIERFAKRLATERGVRAYVIYYQARITYENKQPRFTGQARGIKDEFEYKLNNLKAVVIENGGYREKNRVEFWIVPENAELPAPTPTFTRAETFDCPHFYVYDDSSVREAETVGFTARAYNSKSINDYSLTWKVFGGEIVEGQGADYVKVKLNAAVKRATAYLEIGDLPLPCPKVFSATAEIYKNIIQVDSFGLSANGNTKARTQNFYIELNNNPTAQGYIVVYGGRVGGMKDVAKREKQIRDAMRFLRLDESRVTFIRGGFRETVETDLWMGFDGAEPTPTPTIDEKFVGAPKLATKPRPRKK